MAKKCTHLVKISLQTMQSKADGVQRTGHKGAFLNSTAIGLFDF
jgi:hypothetical protein